jgi:hypothetical protein
MKHRSSIFPIVSLAGAFAFGLAAVHCVHADPPRNVADTPIDTETTESKPVAPLPGEGPSGPTGGQLAQYLDGMSWGMTHAQVTEAYNKVNGIIDQDYAPALTKTEPGIKMQQVEADRDNRKAAFARSWVRFTDTPTGYDSSGIRGEFTYKNEESVQVIDRNGVKRFYFYIGAPPGERLWKIYDEVPLKEGGALGATFKDAALKITKKLNQPGALKKADSEKGPRHTEVEWSDSLTHLRIVDRSDEHVLGFVCEDKGTLANLDNLRKNKPTDPFAIDPSIQNITKNGVSDPNAANPATSASGKPAGKPKPKGK